MKKLLFGLIIVLLPAVVAGGAAAENLAGKIGVTARVGFTLPADSEWNFGPTLSGDAGFIGGGGLIFGVTRNLAMEVEATNASYDLNADGIFRDGTASVTNLTFGVQYRFASSQKATPYLGGGLSILFTDYTDADVDTVVGVNLKGGIDYFVAPRIALNFELQGTISPTASMYDQTHTYPSGSFDPTSFSGLFGVRYFFN